MSIGSQEFGLLLNGNLLRKSDRGSRIEGCSTKEIGQSTGDAPCFC